MLGGAGGNLDANEFSKRAANAALLRMAAIGWGKEYISKRCWGTRLQMTVARLRRGVQLLVLA
jgi:hypothetical protein